MEVAGVVNGCGMGLGPFWSAVCREVGNSLLPPGQVSLPGKGLRGFPFLRGRTAYPPHGRRGHRLLGALQACWR